MTRGGQGGGGWFSWARRETWTEDRELEGGDSNNPEVFSRSSLSLTDSTREKPRRRCMYRFALLCTYPT